MSTKSLEDMAREAAFGAAYARYQRGERLDLETVQTRLYEMIMVWRGVAGTTDGDDHATPSKETCRTASFAAQQYYFDTYGHPYIEDETLAAMCVGRVM